MSTSISVEGLGKRYVLGKTFERTLSSRIGDMLRGGRSRDEQAVREEFWALRDVDLQVREGEAVGIIGGNGAGKSTLLKILSRITQPTLGRASIRGRLASLLEVGTGFHPELTGRENMFLNGAILGMRRAEVARKFDEIVAFSGVERFIDTPVKRYSSGMYVRLAFAVAAHLEPEVLIVDEVLAVGDAEFQRLCLGKMRNASESGRTVLFVSHNMAAIQKLCSRAVWMREGRVAEDGDPEKVIASYLTGTAQAAPDRVEGGVLYARADEAPDQSGATIESVRLLDEGSQAIDNSATWLPTRLRLTFRLSRAFRSFSPEIFVTTAEGVPLLRTSASPDRGAPLSLGEGRYSMDCTFERLPLAAGDYNLVVWLTIPRVEVLSRVELVGRLSVRMRDVFESGHPPMGRRYLVATEHSWSSPELEDA